MTLMRPVEPITHFNDIKSQYLKTSNTDLKKLGNEQKPQAPFNKETT